MEKTTNDSACTAKRRSESGPPVIPIGCPEDTALKPRVSMQQPIKRLLGESIFK
jgi:hypothetical protein